MSNGKINDEVVMELEDSRLTTVFVYGTLMLGERNHKLLAGSASLGKAFTEEGFTLHDLGDCPGMARGGLSRVSGEVYEVTPETLSVLDELEGHPDWYERTSIRLDDGRHVEAYLMTADQMQGAELISSGDWRKRTENL
jgi:gamma-glutamylaminecyclotransferase